VHWDVTEPNGGAKSLGFEIDDSRQAALDVFNQAVGGLRARAGITYINLPAPQGAFCFTLVGYEDYVCNWVDGAVNMTSAAPGGTTSSCTAIFLDGQAELRAVDPADQY
jgi:hypothetical protein